MHEIDRARLPLMSRKHHSTGAATRVTQHKTMWLAALVPAACAAAICTCVQCSTC